MNVLLCNACLRELPTIDNELERIQCPHCLGSNIVHKETGTTTIVNGQFTNRNSKQQLVRISDDLITIMDALKSLNHQFKDVINDGIALYINHLPDSEKEKIAQIIEWKQKKGD